MEVHHHPQVEKKSFKEYLLEGLMIFLAVTMGFFAESFREHLVNKEKEEQYVHSFYDDLQNDQKGLQRLIKNINYEQLGPATYLPGLFQRATTTEKADSIYYFLRYFIRQQGIRPYLTERTIEQIKNAGEMRLITNKQIADGLIDYYKDISFIDYLQQSLLVYKTKLLDNLPQIFRSEDYAMAIDSLDEAKIPTREVFLSNTDPVVLNRILIEIEDIRALSNTVKREVEVAMQKNKAVEKIIKPRD